MPMDGALLAQEVAAQFGAEPTDFLKKFCAAVILHIQSQAQINGVAGVGLVSSTGPVTGAVILPPGSIL